MVGEVQRALRIEAAKVEIAILDDQACLPASRSAGFIQLMGVLAVLAGLYSLTESISSGIVTIIFGGFIIAAGLLQQMIFDVRTLMLRDCARRGVNGLISSEKIDA